MKEEKAMKNKGLKLLLSDGSVEPFDAGDMAKTDFTCWHVPIKWKLTEKKEGVMHFCNNLSNDKITIQDSNLYASDLFEIGKEYDIAFEEIKN